MAGVAMIAYAGWMLGRQTAVSRPGLLNDDPPDGPR